WSQVHRDGEGRPAGATIYGHDVTARVTAERRTALEATMLKAIINNIDIAVWAIDREGYYIYQDGKGLARTGLRPHQFIGENLLAQFGDAHPAIHTVRKALAGETPPALEVESHGTLWLNWSLPVSDDSGAAVVGVALDISD